MRAWALGARLLPPGDVAPWVFPSNAGIVTADPNSDCFVVVPRVLDGSSTRERVLRLRVYCIGEAEPQDVLVSCSYAAFAREPSFAPPQLAHASVGRDGDVHLVFVGSRTQYDAEESKRTAAHFVVPVPRLGQRTGRLQRPLFELPLKPAHEYPLGTDVWRVLPAPRQARTWLPPDAAFVAVTTDAETLSWRPLRLSHHAAAGVDPSGWCHTLRLTAVSRRHWVEDVAPAPWASGERRDVWLVSGPWGVALVDPCAGLPRRGVTPEVDAPATVDVPPRRPAGDAEDAVADVWRLFDRKSAGVA